MDNKCYPLESTFLYQKGFDNRMIFSVNLHKNQVWTYKKVDELYKVERDNFSIYLSNNQFSQYFCTKKKN